MEISDLITLAESALAIDLKSDPFIDALERYSLAFDEWFVQNQSELANNPDPLYNSQIDKLVQLHERLVNIVTDEQSEHPEAIRKLKHKGRGIMAYTDIFPKRLSMRRPRQG